MEHVNKIAEIFEQYGWPGILAIGVLLALWFILQKMLKKSSEDNIKVLTEGLKNIAANINSQNEYLVQTITEQSTKQQEKVFELLSQSLSAHDKEKETKHIESVERRIQISDSIMNKLYEILHYHKAQRAVVIEFHNSKENLNGLSFVWYDVQYEAHQRKIIPIGTSCKDMQLSKLYRIIDDIYKECDGTVIYSKEMMESEGIYNLLYNDVEKSINGLVYQGIYNNNNNLIGLVCLEYLGTNKIPEELDVDELDIQVAQISSLLKI